MITIEGKTLKKNIFIVYLLVTGLLTIAGCWKKESVPVETSDFDSLNVYLQIDSVAYKNPDLALNLLETTVPNHENSKTINGVYYNYFKGRIILLQKEGNVQSLSCLEKAMQLAEKFKLQELQVKIYQELSIAYSKQRDVKSALEVLEKAFDLAENIKYKNISNLYIEAGWVIFDLDPGNPKAKEYLYTALEKKHDKSDSVFYAKVYHNLGTIFLRENNLDSALYYVNKAIPVFIKKEMNNTLCNAYNTLGAIYEKKGDKENTIRNYKLSIKKGELAGIETANFYANLGWYYQHTLSDYANALKFYLVSLEKPGNPKDIYAVLESIATIYEQTGQANLALEFYKKAMMQRKVDVEQNYKESIRRLEVEFDVNRNKHKMKELTLDLQNQQMKAHQQRILILSLTLFIAMGFALLLLFLRQKNLKQEYEKVLLEQQLLRSQMNPHFVFNAISVIQFLIKNNQNNQADRYLSKFSRLLRKSLENSTGQFAPIQDEIELLEDYLALQKLRFTDEFEYNIITYDGFEEDIDLIPPMIIQPFVENCIEHGIRDIGRKGEITITLTRSEKTFICKVEDNGRGINQVEKSSGLGKRSLSTKISKKRLQILQKKLKIESKIEIIDRMETFGQNGTQIILTMPIIT